MQLSPDLEQRLRNLMRVFLEENTKLNLSAMRTEEACWPGNILDSLPFLDLIEQELIPAPRSLIDVGTGGGFPLLPLAIMLKMTECTGLDSIGKKIEAVKRIVQALKLENVKLIADRAEVIGQEPMHRERYDIVTSRAVAPLPTLLEFTVPLAAIGGCIVLWKSMHIDEELRASAGAQTQLHCRLEYVHTYNIDKDWPANRSASPIDQSSAHLRQGYGGQPPLREGWGERQLLIFRKTEATPMQFPRDVGMAKKEPL